MRRSEPLFNGDFLDSVPDLFAESGDDADFMGVHCFGVFQVEESVEECELFGGESEGVGSHGAQPTEKNHHCFFTSYTQDFCRNHWRL
jgi:hypothetical protein